MEQNIDYYKYQRKQVQNRINDREARNAAIQRDIERLEAAYNKMSNIKRNNAQNALLVKSRSKLSYVAGNVKWRGKSKADFDNIMNRQVSNAAQAFYKSIDQMLDEIGTALYRKKSEYDTGCAALNTLIKSWNYFNGVIRNWTN